MTEREWLSASDPEPMLIFFEQKASDRKFRLFACACSRLLWKQLDSTLRNCVETAERFADGEVSEEHAHLLLSQCGDTCGHSYAGSCVLEALEKDAERHTGFDVAVQASHHASQAMYPSGPLTYESEPWLSIRRTQIPLVRDIFGNPFRPVAFDPAWRTSDAVALARAMYESREFGAMPILADALQDAGCDNIDVLTHCRAANQVHVRGCWVCDLVLSK